MPVSKKKTTVIKNVNKNKNNINIHIHAKKKTVAKKSKKSSPSIPQHAIISPVFNVSVPIPSQYASMPSYIYGDKERPPVREPVKKPVEAENLRFSAPFPSTGGGRGAAPPAFLDANALNTPGNLLQRPIGNIPVDMNTQTDFPTVDNTVDESEIERLRKLDQKRVDNNERRRQKRKTEKSIYDPDYKFDDL